MVIVEHQLLKLLRYRKAFFPTPEQVHQLADEMGPCDIVRLRCQADERVSKHPRLIEEMPTATVCIDLTQSLDAILASMKANPCRRNIRQAEKMADRIRIEVNEPGTPRAFLSLFNDFARRKGTVPRLSWRTLQKYLRFSDLWMLYFDEQLLCGHGMLRDADSGRVFLMFSANRRFEGSEISALTGVLNRYLHWQEIQRYRDEGMKIYDFGGISHENPHAQGFNQFKVSFGGEITSERSYTFAPAGRLAKLGIDTYKRLRTEGIFGLV